ncbi:MAG: hypothetical protein ACE5IR_27015, partial [bacterium]
KISRPAKTSGLEMTGLVLSVRACFMFLEACFLGEKSLLQDFIHIKDFESGKKNAGFEMTLLIDLFTTFCPFIEFRFVNYSGEKIK